MFICSKNLEYLKTIPDNTYDSIVTDAPYGLGKEPNAAEVLLSWVTTGYHEVEGGGFMGKKWDAFVPQPKFWKEIFRVLKPGGYVLCFFGTRTYDWGVMAMRLAGFEIRDQILWLYSQGFPKNHNISKAIDKQEGTEFDSQLASGVGFMNPEGTSGYNTTKTQLVQVGESSDNAKKWFGWGTALKPACEPICLARKPMIGTVIDNVLTFGTGGINIEASRIPFESDADKQGATWGRGTDILGGNYVGGIHSSGKENIEANENGRWPANVVLDEEAAAQLDTATGILTSGKPAGVRTGDNNSIYSPLKGKIPVTGYGDAGGASRFFYVAKPTKEERNKGCEHMELKSSGIKNASGRGYSESDPYKQVLNQNTHPTVKPISLMRYLVRMITPPGGHCCDPFVGSGTTHIACDLEGFECTGIDDDPESIIIAEARRKGWEDEVATEAYLRNNPEKSRDTVKSMKAADIAFLEKNIQISLF